MKRTQVTFLWHMHQPDYRLPGDGTLFHALNGHGNAGLDALFVAASSRIFGVLGAVLLNGVTACADGTGELPACVERVNPSSKAKATSQK